MPGTNNCNEGPPDTPRPHPAVCRKCGSMPYILLDKIHVECKDCFLESCNKKLRSTIGKSKLLRNNDPIFIAHSGGPSSTTLLDLIKNSIEYDTRREQKFRPSIIYVDTESILADNFETTRKLRMTNMSRFLGDTSKLYPNWPLYWTTIEMPEATIRDHEPLYYRFEPQVDLSDAKYGSLLDNAEAFSRFSQRCHHLDLTDKQAHIRNQISFIINGVAESINSKVPSPKDRFEYIFVASSATRLANDLLVNVILGKGSDVCSIVDICDRTIGVPIMRPMRDFSQKEIALYLRAKNIDVPAKINEFTFANRRDSIQTATEAFLTRLNNDYPSTYSTLLRTGNKMQRL